MPTQAFSYQDVSIREDLWDQIKDIEPLETYVTSHAGTVEVGQKVHSWLNDPITATSSVPTGVVEGADTTYAVTDPSLVVNYTLPLMGFGCV